MAYVVTHWRGNQERNLPMDQFSRLIGELDESDGDHGDVSVAHDTGWSVTASRAGTVTWEHLEDSAIEPRHLVGVSRGEMVDLLQAVAVVDLEALGRRRWKAGYPAART